MIEKSRSLEISQSIIDLIIDKYDRRIEGYIDTFNNYRETGLVLNDLYK